MSLHDEKLDFGSSSGDSSKIAWLGEYFCQNINKKSTEKKRKRRGIEVFGVLISQ